ncbi:MULTISPECIES: efflux RND transporter permease subunit [Dyadobacter]|uniref:Efflux RND transporter permease subunit n=1 Tax=Dyadobacter chenhuakuii TaxID=2909339 RepID=A0ABY4XJQ4_9BACT|nr:MULTISPECIES: efflux RND transporter permease subunit [Dyadobacter]MCF2496402.1 efflux RND transporter permease subunit [Dyadobacter chenhuakuii]MCF2519432.1 efflux RND transporter permease subunit [Dyadobacter sp. CY351]USJ30459.1 efflux RND transporter permease subunit [Dyadobacter chenhuakuii]
MYQLIRTALRQPISIVVVVIGILFFSILSIRSIPVDIFPNLDLPTIYVVQPYGGMAPDQMDGFIATRYQDHFLYVSGIRDVDVKTIQGLSLIKLSFYPGTDMAQAAAEVANNVSRAKAYMPEGTVPPQVVRFDASSVPIGQMVFESSSRSLNEIQDFASSRVRPMFSRIEGVSSPPPFGGNQRTIVIRVDPERIRSYHLTPEEIIKSIVTNNQPSPAGNIRMGDKTLMTPVNSLIKQPEDFLNIPIRIGAGPTVFVRDVGTVEDGADVTVSYALINGRRAVYIPVVKKSDASTLDVVNNIRAALPQLRNAVPEDVKISYEFDQSVYVTNSLKSLITEGILGALLTGLMVLLFLRDWRSVIIVIVTIPISILSAVILMNLFGQTINIMTLSGLALAIGVLVDQATVTIENIHQHQEMGKPKEQAIWDACKEIAFPEFLILLAILAVFAPSFVMSGIPRSMFLPLSLAVGFAMIASFLLSQTLVPVLANWLLKDHPHHEAPTLALDQKEIDDVIEEGAHPSLPPKGFEKFKLKYIDFLSGIMRKGKLVVPVYLIGAVALIVGGFFLIGTDILPKANSHQFQMRLRIADGTRVERTEQATLKVLNLIKSEVGKEHVEISSAYVGTVPSSYGTSNIFVFNSGPHEAVLQVSLREDFPVKMDALKEKLRERIGKEIPALKISFEPIELVDKIMSQGASTPIEVSVAAKDVEEAGRFAKKIQKEMQHIAFLRDVEIAQPLEYPVLNVEINRERAGQLGITSTQVARSMVAATSSSRFTDKNLWLDDAKGLAYQVQVQIPEYQMTSVEDIGTIPLKTGVSNPLLADVATFSEKTAPGEYDRAGPNRLVTVTANIHKKDLGAATKAVQTAIKNAGEPPRGVLVELKGQSNLLTETLGSLQVGLVIAIVIMFLLLSATYQSFKLSLVVLSTIPAVVVGSIGLLLITGATLNLQSYMGLIMSVGVSVANAILMVTNAENLRLQLNDSHKAVILAAGSRIRPILMTSIAMIAGMIPMASGMGEGGDQIAPLGQAVIGGLIASTLASLLILPAVFTMVQKKASIQSLSLDPEDPESNFFRKQLQTSLSMNTLKSFLIIGMLSFSIMSCSSEAETTEHKEQKAEKEPAVEMAAVQSLKPAKHLTLPGELKPWNKVSIHPKVKGFVKTVHVDRGTMVLKGQILATLEAPEVLSELSQAKAQLLASEAALHESQTKFQTSSMTYNRLLRTNKTQGAVSLNELDVAKARSITDSSAVAMAQGNVQAARSYMETKSQLAKYLTVTAPFDGIITERNISPGALVGPGESGAKPLFILEDNTKLRLTLAIPENLSNAIPSKGEIAFTVSASPEKQYKGIYARSSRTLSEENRSMMTEFDVDNRSNELKAGMYAQVSLNSARTTNTLFVPTSAVVYSSEQVFVIREKDKKAEWVPVKRGTVVDSLVEVFGDLHAGDPIVKKASEEFRNGEAL